MARSTPLMESGTKTAGLTALAMLAFAANSILCRMALEGGTIDAASFTAVRLVSGATVLWAVVAYRSGAAPARANPAAVAALFAYAICFSFAYLSLTASTGTLILFAAVQLTMFVAGLRAGERMAPQAWFGFVLALGGLAWLLSPGVTAPSLAAAALMAISGFSWGIYSLIGRKVPDPLAATASNFLYAAPLGFFAVLCALPFGELRLGWQGVVLGTTSGAVASGLGYVVWYSALRRLTATRAATVQISVPVLAAIGGVLLLAEPVDPRLVLSSIAVLAGIYLTLRGKLPEGRKGAKAPPRGS